MSRMVDLFSVRDYEREAFLGHWCGPDELPYGEDVLIATYPKDPPDGDGQSVNVYCCALPARFYTLKVEAGQNSVEEPKDNYEVSTGSGQHLLAADIAEAISTGLLTFYSAATLENRI